MRLRFLRSFFSPPVVRQNIFCILPALGVLCLLWACIGTGESITRHFIAVREANPLLTEVMWVISDWGNVVFYLLYARILWKAVKERDAAGIRFVITYVAVQLLVSFVLLRLIKITVGKPRPLAVLEGKGYEPFSLQYGRHSFPSGHSAEIIGAATLTAAWFKRSWATVLCGAMVALVAFSRIYLGWHHLADVLAGLIAGSLTAFWIHYLCMRGTS